jgi:competence protein ComEA
VSLTSSVRRRERVSLARERLLRLWSPSPAGAHDDDDVAGGAASSLAQLLPGTLRRGRLALDGWAVVAVVAVALLGVLVAAWFAWRGAGTEAPLGRAALLTPGAAVPIASSKPTPTTAGPSPTAALLVVDVAGRVHRPGLVRLPPGSRVADALVAAGGVLPGVDLAAINLAALVTDGEQIVVGVPGMAGSGGAAGSGGSGGSAGSGTGSGTGDASSGPVDLNAATLEQLEALPGVGPVLAQRILDFRTAHGHFSDVGELREVGGIGERKYAEIAPKVRV